MRSLRARLAAGTAAVAILSVALTALVSIGLVRRSAEDQARADLRRLAATIAAEPDDGLLSDDRERVRALRLLAVHGDELAVVLPGGRPAFQLSTPIGIQIANQVDLAALPAADAVAGSVRLPSGDYVYVAVPGPMLRARTRPSTVIVARPVRVTRAVFAPAVGRIALVAAAAVLLAVAAAGVIARALTRSVRDLSHAAGRVAGGDLDHRVPEAAADEIGELARAFNRMTASLAESRRREREFLASVSHELRTPLTAIAGYAEALADGTAGTPARRAEAVAIIRAETARLDRMVGDVMDLARVGAGDLRLEVREVDAAETVRDAAAAHGAAAAEAGVTLTVELLEPLVVRTDPDRLRQVISNLIDNALRVTEAGGAVSVAGRATGGRVVIEIADTGPGIPPEDLPHVFERSYLWRRARGSQPVGTGLGLAIVRELVAALDGRIAVDSAPGGGTTFRIELLADA